MLAALVGPLENRGFLLAFSGGMDSTVLLAALAAVKDRYRFRLRALHVDHGIDPRSAQWAKHCRHTCGRLGVALTVHPVTLDGPANLEARARRARYRALGDALEPGEVLVAAHHRDDQAETVLLQLVRGSGTAGLGGMAPLSRLGRNLCARPLLGFARTELEAWARSGGLPPELGWVEDPSNADPSANARSYLRAVVMPALQRRWPEAPEAICRSAAHLREQRCLAASLAAADLARCEVVDSLATGLGASVVDARRLAALPRARRRNALRQWIARIARDPPTAARLEHIDATLVQSAAPATAELGWGRVRVSRYRHRLYVYPALVDAPEEPVKLCWSLDEPLALPWAGVSLVPRRVTGAGLAIAHLARGVELRRRAGGERVRLPGRAHRSALKKLFQGAGVPPWMRARLAVVWIGGQPAAVPGLWYFAPFAVSPGQDGVQIELSGGEGRTAEANAPSPAAR